MNKKITLRVNGKKHELEVPTNRLLVDALRYDLGLTGTKEGCSVGVCGACTVLMDGKMVSSCIAFAVFADGRQITTVEGLESPSGELHPVQQAFIDELGPQCGFCTPGQVMSAVALLQANPNPTREEARAAMAGNLCRCGAYDHYLNGIMRAAREA